MRKWTNVNLSGTAIIMSFITVSSNKLGAVFYMLGKSFLTYKKRSLGMRTAAYKVGVASDRRRRKNVPRHILCSMLGKLIYKKKSTAY